MIVSKKTLGFLILTIICLSLMMLFIVLPTELTQREEEPYIETKTELILYKAKLTSEGYVDSPNEYVVINNDVNMLTLHNITYEVNVDYNVTFQILNVSKGTFDDAVIINATAVRFTADEIAYGANRSGIEWVRLYISSDVKLKMGGWIEGENEDIKWGAGIFCEVTFPPKEKRPKATTKVNDAATSEVTTEIETPTVPEFPAGESIALALGMGMGLLILFMFRSKNLKSPRNTEKL